MLLSSLYNTLYNIFNLFTKEQTLFFFLSRETWNENSTDFLTRAFCDCEIEPEALTTYFLETVFSRTLSKKWKECGVLERPDFVVFAKPLHHLYLAPLSILPVDSCEIKPSYLSRSISATLLLMPIKRECAGSAVKQLLYFQTEGS